MKKNLLKVIALVFVCVLMVTAFAGCGNKAEKLSITSAEDLNGARVAVQEGTTGDIYVSEELEGVQVSRFKKAVDCGVELMNDRVDAVVLDKLPAEKIVEKNPELKILDTELTKEEYAIAVNKGNTELVEKINATLAAMKNDGTYEQIRNVFMPDDPDAKGELPDRGAVTSDKKIVMGTNAEFEPFEYIDDKGEIAGFDIEVAHRIAKDMGAELVIENMAFDSLIGAVTTGKIDMAIAGMSVTEERKQNVDFSDPYFEATQVIIVKK